MAKYILLDTVLAEIERRISILQKSPYENHKTICHLDSLKQSYNSLEVKEVDLEFLIHEEYDAAAKTEYDCIERAAFTKFEFTQLAKRFFELGLNASNPLTWEDVRDIYRITKGMYNENQLWDYPEDFFKVAFKRFKELKGE